ncbi:MAG: 3-hydroxyacyl-CoA dehydrogenase NAD-binding domain-containing protein [Stappiaceae bacterium]
MAVSFKRNDSVALVILDNPPVNAMGLAVRQGLRKVLDRLRTEDGLTRVILTGSERIFAAGGDAREFDSPPVAPHLPDLIAEIEASPVPWIAALTGAALGGGCELALGCRYRIAKPGIQIGLPEVSLGVVPGAGGTQRLPRLIGIAQAVAMISTGKPIASEKAQEIGLIDAIADDPIAVGTSLDMGSISLTGRVCDFPRPDNDSGAIDAARQTVEKRQKGQIAPLKAIELVAAASDGTFADGLAAERKVFLELRASEQAKALRHVFFAEKGAKAPGWLTSAPAELDEVAVVGGGTMGAGIAYALLDAGCAVTLLETDGDGVERAIGNVEKIVAASRDRGLIDEVGAATRRARLTVTHDFARASKATLAIEAAFESMDVKKAVFSALEQHLPKNAVLASNTSYLNIDEIAFTLSDPSRFVGLHFFAPAHIMKLLEVVRGEASADVALATGFLLAKKLRKIPVLAGVCDGFIGNRILERYREAAETLLIEGTNPWELDEAMVAFGYAMGPYEAQDLSGLDIAYANRRRQDTIRDPKRRYVSISDRMVEEGRLGRKVGVGWYRYPGGGGKVIDPLIEDLVREEAYFAKVARRSFSDDQIRERLLLAMINEAADILSEGIAENAQAIDLVTVFGYGFPRWRGGLMHYADSLGIEHVIARLEELAEEDPVVWRVSTTLLDCKKKGISLAEFQVPEVD